MDRRDFLALAALVPAGAAAATVAACGHDSPGAIPEPTTAAAPDAGPAPPAPLAGLRRFVVPPGTEPAIHFAPLAPQARRGTP